MAEMKGPTARLAAPRDGATVSVASPVPAAAHDGATGAGRKVLVVCNDYDYFLNHRIPVFEDIARQGYRVIVCCGGRLREPVRHSGMEFRPIECERYRFSPRKDLALAFRILAQLRREKPDVLQTITVKPNLFGGLAAMLYRLSGGRRLRLVMMNPGLGRIYSNTDDPKLSLMAKLSDQGFRMALRSPSSHVVFENLGDRRRWVRTGLVPRSRTHVLAGAGIDVDHFAPDTERTPPPPFRVLFASRLLKSKGIENFLAAAERLGREGTDVEFVVAGEVDRRDPDHFAMDEAPLGANVRYAGHLDDIRGLLADAHVVCLPTAYGEGLPRILLEAAAMGCALVATDIAGCKAIVRDGETGRVVPLVDGKVDDEALADAIRWLAKHPGEAAEFGRNARRLVVQGGFDQKAVNRRLAGIILGEDEPAADDGPAAASQAER